MPSLIFHINHLSHSINSFECPWQSHLKHMRGRETEFCSRVQTIWPFTQDVHWEDSFSLPQLCHWIENSGKPIWVEHNAKPALAAEFCLVGFYLQESESEEGSPESQINIRWIKLWNITSSVRLPPEWSLIAFLQQWCLFLQQTQHLPWSHHSIFCFVSVKREAELLQIYIYIYIIFLPNNKLWI